MRSLEMPFEIRLLMAHSKREQTHALGSEMRFFDITTEQFESESCHCPGAVGAFVVCLGQRKLREQMAQKLSRRLRRLAQQMFPVFVTC